MCTTRQFPGSPKKGPSSAYRVLVALGLILVIGSVNAHSQNPPAGQQGSSIESLTLNLVNLNARYHAGGPASDSQLLSELQSAAASRQQVLAALMESDPAAVLRVAIPSNISNTMPPTVRNYMEKDTTAQGVLEVLAEMNGTPEKTTGVKMHYGLTTAQGKLQLHFANNAPENLLTGSVVRVHGVQVASDLALASGNTSSTSTTSSLQVVSAALAPTASGAVSTLVILVNFQDNPTYQPWAPSTVQNVVFSQTSNWDLENSFQHTWLTGNVAGWLTIPVNSTNCATSTIKSDALAAAQAAGYNLSNYAHFIYLMSSNTGCSAWWGLASIGGSDVWVNGQYNIAVHVFAHEMGHNFGLYHAHTLSCGTQVTCSAGTLNEYGDGIDVMGMPTYNAPHYDTFHKEQLGWLNSGSQPPITTVTSSGTYQISPYEAEDTNPKALKILQSGGSNSYYYVEFRQALGSDSFLSSYSDIMGGTVVHLASPSNANSSDLLDMTPTSPTTFNDPALVVGRSYTDSTAGVTITPISAGSTGATVQVTFGTGTCSAANPTVSISPLQTQYVTAGTAVNFMVTVKDNDNGVCPASNFNLSDALPSGWTAVWNIFAMTLSPGTSGSATLTVTSPIGTADGFYNFSVGATNASATSYTGSASATYVISTPVPMSMTVTTNQSSYLPGQTVNVTATSSGAPLAGGSITITVTKPNGAAVSLNATITTNGSATGNYRVKRQDPLGTYKVSAVASASNAAAAQASTTFTVQ